MNESINQLIKCNSQRRAERSLCSLLHKLGPKMGHRWMPKGRGQHSPSMNGFWNSGEKDNWEGSFFKFPNGADLWYGKKKK